MACEDFVVAERDAAGKLPIVEGKGKTAGSRRHQAVANGLGTRHASRAVGERQATSPYRRSPRARRRRQAGGAIGQAAIQQGCKVFYRETHILLDELAEAVADGTRKEYMESVATVPLLIIDDFGMRKLPHTAAEDLLEIIMRRYERFSTLLTSNRPVDDWGKLLGDVAAVSAMLDRLLHHGHVLKCGPRSWRTKAAAGANQ